jgi:succinate dehydrogenase/fumarate reductase cytochrome b subunit
MDRAEAWATFVLVLVGGLILLSLLGVLVGAYVDHAFNGLMHTLSSPLSLAGVLH